MTNPVSLTIDPKAVENILSAQLQAAIAAQFTNTPGFLEKIIAGVVTRSVNRDGKHDTGYGTQPLIEWLAANTIREAAEVAMREWVNENKPVLLAAIKKELNAQRNDMVKAFVTACTGALSTNLSIHADLKVSTEKKDRY